MTKTTKCPSPLFDSLKNFLDKEAKYDLDLSSYPEQDLKYLREFLYVYRGSADTYNSYRRETERLLHWCTLVAKKKLNEIRRADFEQYLDFCQNPPKSWIGTKNSPRFLDKDGMRAPNHEWRPFVATLSKTEVLSGKKPDINNYSLSEKAFKEVFAVLGSFYNFLIQENYTEINPVLQIRQKNKYYRKTNSSSKVIRKLSDLQWGYVIETAKIMATKEPNKHNRTLFIMISLYGMYLRISELADTDNHTPVMGDFFRDNDGLWWFKTVGKGNKERLISVSNNMLEAFKNYRISLQLPALPSPGDLPDLPLDEDIGSLDSLDSSRELLCNTVIDIITRVIMGHVHGGIVMPVLDHVAEPYVQKVAAQAEQYFLSQPRSNSWSRFTTRSVAGFAAGDEPETNSVVKTKSRESMSSLADDTSLGHSSWLVAKHAGNDSVEVVSYDEAYHDYYSADFYTPEQPGVFSYVQAAGEGIYNGFVNTYDSVNYVLHNPVGVVENTAVLLWDSANAVSDVLFDISTISSRQRNAVRLWSACNTVDQFLNAQSVDRVRMVSEFGTSVATGTFTYRLAWSGATSVTRRGVALNYYMKNGYSVERALDHMRGIDFSSSVQVVTIPSGSQMTQYVKSGSRLGSYFTRPMTHPDSLGIFTGVRHPIRMVATSEAQALRTKAKAFKDTHTVPGITIDCNGGGVQYFIPDPKKSFK